MSDEYARGYAAGLREGADAVAKLIERIAELQRDGQALAIKVNQLSPRTTLGQRLRCFEDRRVVRFS